MGGGFNRHHPMWDEEHNQYLFTGKSMEESGLLIELLASHDMVMMLLKDIPTLESMATKNWTCPDNVFCSAGIEDQIVYCTTEPRLRGPSTNLVPILMVLEILVGREANMWRRNFRDVNWEKYLKVLEGKLLQIPGPEFIETEENFEEVVEALTRAIQGTISEVILFSKPLPHSKM